MVDVLRLACFLAFSTTFCALDSPLVAGSALQALPGPRASAASNARRGGASELGVARLSARVPTSGTYSAKTSAPPAGHRSERLRPYSRKEVEDLIRRHAAAHRLDPALPLRIAFCESGHRWNARNGSSSASGVFQYVRRTWARTSEGRKGTSVFDAEANIRMAVTHIALHGTAPWASSQHCWRT
jgi:hypothetical protein